MSGAILFAIDARHPHEGALGWVKTLAAATGRRVVVVHVHEYAASDWGEFKVCCEGDTGERNVEAVVTELRSAGLTAEPVVLSSAAHSTLVARALVEAASRAAADIVIVASRGRGDLGSMALGSVAHRLIRHAELPVLVVPSTAADQESVAAPAGRRSQPVAPEVPA